MGMESVSMGKPEKIEESKEQAPRLSKYLEQIDKKIALAEAQLQKQNSEPWSVNESGFSIEPKGVAKATEKLNYLKEMRQLFSFTDVDPSTMSFEDALKRIEDLTNSLHGSYQQRFGEKDPKDVEESKRAWAIKAWDEIKRRDKIVSEVSSYNL
jgi:hypothetical protein